MKVFLLLAYLFGQASGSITIVWNPNSETMLAGYNVYRSDVAGSYAARLNATLLPVVDAPTFTDATAEPGKTYYYTVRAVLKDGSESGPSNEIRAKVDVAPDVRITSPLEGAIVP